MIPTDELEARLTELWHRFESACWTKDKSATRLWREIQDLRAKRTESQRQHALFRAGLNPDGSQINPPAVSRK